MGKIVELSNYRTRGNRMPECMPNRHTWSSGTTAMECRAEGATDFGAPPSELPGAVVVTVDSEPSAMYALPEAAAFGGLSLWSLARALAVRIL